jgi:hypothetical protein
MPHPGSQSGELIRRIKMNEYWKTTVDLMESSKRIISAVDIVQAALTEGDPGEVEFASEMLAQAASDYAGYSGSYESFSFNEMAILPKGMMPQQQLTSNLLVNILLDLKVANILMMVSQATGETVGPATADDLETAACWLETLVDQVALPLTWTADTPTTPVHFAFVESPVAPSVHPATDLAVAKANFQRQVNEMLAILVAQTKDILQAGWEVVKELDQAQLIAAIGQIDQGAPDVPRQSKLLQQSLNLATQTLQKLIRLLGPACTELLQEEARQLSAQLMDKTTLLDEFLIHTYRVAETKSYIVNLLNQTKTDLIHLNNGGEQLTELYRCFVEQMTILSRIITALNSGKRLAEFGLPQVTTMALFGAFYLVVMDYAILAGMDFADSAILFNFVPGVISISEATLV